MPPTLKQARDHFRRDTCRVLTDAARKAAKKKTRWIVTPSGQTVVILGDGEFFIETLFNEYGHMYARQIDGARLEF